MADNDPPAQPSSWTGSIAANLHEGSRSEYLAQFAFSAFGTAVPVPHQEDSGIDVYCTLLERNGQRAWPRAYFSVQVKSTMSPWVFPSQESVRWIVEHPLPIVLCVVQKSEARLLVYHTTPRFAVWALPTQPDRLELIPGTQTKADTVGWVDGNSFRLDAPILNFTVAQILDVDFRARAADVLKLWIDHDVENLVRIRSGIHQFRVPADYEMNSTKVKGWTQQGGRFRDESLPVVHGRIKELLGLLATHHYGRGEMVTATIYAMALRQLSPEGYSESWDQHNVHLHLKLNELLGLDPPSYVYQGCDSLLRLLKDELARHGITEPTRQASESN